MFDVVKKVILSMKPKAKEITLDTNLIDLDFDSLDSIELLMYIEDELKIEINMDLNSEWLDCNTVSDIINFLNKVIN